MNGVIIFVRAVDDEREYGVTHLSVMLNDEAIAQIKRDTAYLAQANEPCAHIVRYFRYNGDITPFSNPAHIDGFEDEGDATTTDRSSELIDARVVEQYDGEPWTFVVYNGAIVPRLHISHMEGEKIVEGERIKLSDLEVNTRATYVPPLDETQGVSQWLD
jgi:hypothetical protein